LALLPITVAGPRRSFTGFSIKPLRAPVPLLYSLVFLILHVLALIAIFVNNSRYLSCFYNSSG